MNELTSLQLDPLFQVALVGLLGTIVHRIVIWTNNYHGSLGTRNFMIILCAVLGVVFASLFKVFGKNTILNFLGSWAEFGVGSLAIANLIWVWGQRVVPILTLNTTQTTTETTTIVDKGIAAEPKDTTPVPEEP